MKVKVEVLSLFDFLWRMGWLNEDLLWLAHLSEISRILFEILIKLKS
jgi:hypothetical protein